MPGGVAVRDPGAFTEWQQAGSGIRSRPPGSGILPVPACGDDEGAAEHAAGHRVATAVIAGLQGAVSSSAAQEEWGAWFTGFCAVSRQWSSAFAVQDTTGRVPGGGPYGAADVGWHGTCVGGDAFAMHGGPAHGVAGGIMQVSGVGCRDGTRRRDPPGSRIRLSRPLPRRSRRRAE